MLFTTLEYGAFFGVVFVAHWLAPRPLRRPMLLVASYFFYLQAIPQYGFLIGGMTLANYLAGFAIGRAQGRWRRGLLIGAIIIDLATLGFFKYIGLIVQTLTPALHLLPSLAGDSFTIDVILPLGISFFTFEFIHYVVEVARGQPPIRNPIDFALFAAFFPTQIAGPIKRFPDWVKQLRQPVALRDVRADEAVFLIVRGAFKKIAIADVLSPLVAQAFSQPDRLGFGAAWLAIYAFAAQIYCDFSGYTDIGRGCALLLGYAVPENFNNPYQSRNPTEFWKRWHISLSRWLQDYLYIPLGGSRVPEWRMYLNLMITMALGGLWHGASWHFMAWGIFQGGLLVGHKLYARWLGSQTRLGAWTASRTGVLAGQIATFQLVCLGWVLFRAPSIASALQFFRLALVPAGKPLDADLTVLTTGANALPATILLIAALVVVSGWLHTWVRAGEPGWRRIEARAEALWMRVAPVARPALYLALVMLIAIWPTGTIQRFIYFQF
jgi:alginate O-acetyltransferase complex protein AlgI